MLATELRTPTPSKSSLKSLCTQGFASEAKADGTRKRHNGQDKTHKFRDNNRSFLLEAQSCFLTKRIFYVRSNKKIAKPLEFPATWLANPD